jgi:predicted transcriptional regulator
MDLFDPQSQQKTMVMFGIAYLESKFPDKLHIKSKNGSQKKLI